MAKRTTHQLIDDLTGDRADETVQFELDGVAYTIDLSAAHAAELRETFGPFMRAATVTRRTGRRSRPSLLGAAQRQAVNTAIRDWARKAGHTVRDRGRIKGDIVAAYHRDNQGADS